MGERSGDEEDEGRADVSTKATTTCTNSQGNEVEGSLLILCENDDVGRENNTQGHFQLASAKETSFRSYVFPGEQIKVLCTIEDEEVSEEQLAELETRHCYSLGLTNVAPEGDGDGNGVGRKSDRRGAVDTLEVSSLNRSQEASSASPVAGIARSVSRCWKESEPKRTVICIEASVPSGFPAQQCTAVLELKQYLRYPLGSSAKGSESDEKRVELFEHFLCRRWTKPIRILSPLKVESFVYNSEDSSPEAFLSVTVGNILPSTGETRDCVLAVQNFQLLSDPPDQLVISQIYPKKCGKHHQEIHPGTEYTFAIRTCFTNLDVGEEKSTAQDVLVDLLLSVSSTVSSSQLIFIHHTKYKKHKESLVQMEITHLGSNLRCLIKNMSKRDKSFKLLLDNSSGPQPPKHLFMDTCIPVAVQANSTKAVTCRVVPLTSSSILELESMKLVDEEGEVWTASKQAILSLV